MRPSTGAGIRTTASIPARSITSRTTAPRRTILTNRTGGSTACSRMALRSMLTRRDTVDGPRICWRTRPSGTFSTATLRSPCSCMWRSIPFMDRCRPLRPSSQSIRISASRTLPGGRSRQPWTEWMQPWDGCWQRWMRRASPTTRWSCGSATTAAMKPRDRSMIRCAAPRATATTARSVKWQASAGPECCPPGSSVSNSSGWATSSPLSVRRLASPR